MTLSITIASANDGGASSSGGGLIHESSSSAPDSPGPVSKAPSTAEVS
jgi:hypothetical protein